MTNKEEIAPESCWDGYDRQISRKPRQARPDQVVIYERRGGGKKAMGLQGLQLALRDGNLCPATLLLKVAEGLPSREYRWIR